MSKGNQSIMPEANTCSICHSKSSRPLFTGYGFDCSSEHFQLINCMNCGLTRLSPLLTNEQLEAYYSSAYYGHHPQQKFTPLIEMLVRFANKHRAKILMNFLSPEHAANKAEMRMLDIGCGRGNFLRALHDYGFDCYGTEIPSYPLPASEPRLTYQNGWLENIALQPQTFTAISIWHVLEHTSDPDAVIKQISKLLMPNGVVAIAVPNFGSTQQRLFGKHWFHLDLPRHLYHFTEKSLITLLNKHDLQPISVQTSSLDQNIFGFIQSAINCLLPHRANLLFTFLKRKLNQTDNKFVNIVYVGLSVLLAAVLLPFSIIENTISAWRGRGATLIIYAKRTSATINNG